MLAKIFRIRGQFHTILQIMGNYKCSNMANQISNKLGNPHDTKGEQFL